MQHPSVYFTSIGNFGAAVSSGGSFAHSVDLDRAGDRVFALEGMVKNRHLSRAISDRGFFEFRRQLEYKAEMRGAVVVVADRFFASSKTCSVCGDKVEKLPLSIRQWDCPTFGTSHDRDVNAAINLRNYAVSDTVAAGGGDGAGLGRKPKTKPAPVKQAFNTLTTFSEL